MESCQLETAIVPFFLFSSLLYLIDVKSLLLMHNHESYYCRVTVFIRPIADTLLRVSHSASSSTLKALYEVLLMPHGIRNIRIRSTYRFTIDDLANKLHRSTVLSGFSCWRSGMTAIAANQHGEF